MFLLSEIIFVGLCIGTTRTKLSLQNHNNQLRLQNIRQQTEKLCRKFPIYSNNWHINNSSLSSALQKSVE